jgi:hypothetical protein
VTAFDVFCLVVTGLVSLAGLVWMTFKLESILTDLADWWMSL